MGSYGQGTNGLDNLQTEEHTDRRTRRQETIKTSLQKRQGNLWTSETTAWETNEQGEHTKCGT